MDRACMIRKRWVAQTLTLTLTLKGNSYMYFPQQAKFLALHVTHYH
jgi:hypothetical protein